MTERKGTTRPRRTTAAAGIPAELSAWFAGETSEAPWSALVYPDDALLHERWQQWQADHPNARPPAGWEWIGGPPPERLNGLPYAQALAEARACHRRGVRLGVYRRTTKEATS